MPTYLLEHLATFTVSPENDLVYPADGMRRLLAMEKTSGIWTQKMLMRLDRKMVNIMDHENKEVVERFPIHLVREPTAFTSSDPKEMYNNIVIYIVGHGAEDALSPNEMHIFQCVNVSARDVVEDLKAFKQGRYRLADKSPQISPNDMKAGYDGSQVSPRMHAQLEARDKFDETSSTSSDKYEKDVNILNRCFDDIEKFIARLQHAAAAFRELEKRRRSRKSKKKDLGDGMLSMRAKPPPEREFEDIFQKFKLSFNLLAKLKAHIHDPNAPELVHFLFTPLALIVDASHDSHYGPNLPSKVLAPLLNKNAVDLLINCLTSKESELWHSLGEAWYVPREQWKGFVPPYKPVFMDGWSPALMDDYGTAASNGGGRGKFEGEDAALHDHSDSEQEQRMYRCGAARPLGQRAGAAHVPAHGPPPGPHPGPQDAQRGRVPPEQPPRQRGSAAARPRRPQPRQRERGVRGARAIRRRADEVRARAEGLHARPDEQEREGGAGDLPPHG